MPETAATYELQIHTAADLAALEKARAQYRLLVEELRKQGKDTSGAESQLAALDAAANSTGAQTARVIAGYEKVREQIKALKGDTAAIDAEIARLKGVQGGGAFGALGEHAGRIRDAFRGADGPINGVLAAVGTLHPAFLAAAGGITASLGAINKGLHEYAERQKAVAALDVGLANKGRLTDEYREKILALADSFSKLSGIDDTAWIAAIGKVQAKGLSSDLDKNAEALKNMAAAVGDVDTAALLLSRALAGNFNRLQMYGFHVDENASKTEKLKDIFQQAAEKGAGQFEARLKTLAGQKQALSTATHQLWENVGHLAFRMGFGDGTARRMANAIEWLNSKIKITDEVTPSATAKATDFSDALAKIEGRGKPAGDAAGEAGDGFDAAGNKAESSAEKVNKYAEAIDRATQAAIAMEDANLAGQLANIAADEAFAKEKGGGKLTAEQQKAFALRRIDAQKKADEAKFTAKEVAIEFKSDENVAATAKATTQQQSLDKSLAEKRRRVGKAFAEAGMEFAPDVSLKEQSDVLGRARAVKNQLLSEAEDQRQAAEARMVMAGRVENNAKEVAKAAAEEGYLSNYVASLKAQLKPLDEAFKLTKDIEKEVLDLEKQSEKVRTDLQGLYESQQKIENERALLKRQRVTSGTESATKTKEELTKAATGNAAEEKARIEAALNLNEELFKTQAPTPEQTSKHRANLARKWEIDLGEIADPGQRKLKAEKARREGFNVDLTGPKPKVRSQSFSTEFAPQSQTPQPVLGPKDTAAPPAPPEAMQVPPKPVSQDARILEFARAENARRLEAAERQRIATGRTPNIQQLSETDPAAVREQLMREREERAAAARVRAEAFRRRQESGEPSAPATQAPGGEIAAPTQPAPQIPSAAPAIDSVTAAAARAAVDTKVSAARAAAALEDLAAAVAAQNESIAANAARAAAIARDAAERQAYAQP